MNKNLDCEVLVIGSGAGGSTIAETLTDQGFEVLMVEEGPNTNIENKIEGTVDSFSYQWRSGGLNAALGDPIISYAEGRCVGGGTEINSAIMQEPPKELIENWENKYSIDNFNYKDINTYVEKALKRVNACYTKPPHGRPSDILKIAGENLNWKTKELKRAQKGTIDINPFLSGTKDSGKQSMSVSLIQESLNKGMNLIPNCRVTKIITKKNKVSHIKAIVSSENKKTSIIIKAKYIFLCCGAIYTPTILKSSKLSKSAGNSIQMHPTIKVIAKFKEPIYADKSHVPLYAITEFMPEIRLGGANFTPGIFAMSLAEDWDNRKHFMKEYDYFGIYYAMVRGTGKGKIRVSPIFNEPIVSYKLSDENWRELSKGTQYLAEAMFAAGATNVIPSIKSHHGWRNLGETKKDIQKKGLPKKTSYLSSVHLFGSCPIGEKESICVANSYGKLNHFENIYLADASIIPEALGVNPQATIMGFSYRVADFFLNSI